MSEKRLQKRWRRENRKNKGVGTALAIQAKNAQIRRERDHVRSLDRMLQGQFDGGIFNEVMR